jgi:hypothetical protein
MPLLPTQWPDQQLTEPEECRDYICHCKNNMLWSQLRICLCRSGIHTNNNIYLPGYVQHIFPQLLRIMLTIWYDTPSMQNPGVSLIYECYNQQNNP